MNVVKLETVKLKRLLDMKQAECDLLHAEVRTLKARLDAAMRRLREMHRDFAEVENGTDN